MYRFIKFAVPALALGLFVAVPSMTRAEDPPATQPAKAVGSITIKVVDADGKAVTGAAVQLLPPRPAGGGGAAGGGRAQRGANAPKPIAEGTTDETGSVTLKGVPVGEYSASARTTGATALQGRGTATVAAADSAAVTITVKPRAARGGGGGGAGNGN